MQIAQELSGYSLGSADLLRRAMGKKIKQEMDQQRASFISGAVARGVPEAKASQIFELVSKFAGYGFNKSHAAAYALIAYQTAYLKANHPLEFFAASMTLDLANSDKLNGFRQELGRLGIRMLPPDINASEAIFSVEHDGPSGSRRHPLRAGRRQDGGRAGGAGGGRGTPPRRSVRLAGRLRAPPRSASSQQAADREPGARRRLRLAQRQPAPGVRQRRGDRALRRGRLPPSGPASRSGCSARPASSRLACSWPTCRTGRRWSG